MTAECGTKKSKLVEKAAKDDAFRQELIGNPKATMEKELGVKLPPELKVKVVEQTQDTHYIVLPAKKSQKLSDAELDAIAGAGHSSCLCCDWDTVHPCGG